MVLDVLWYGALGMTGLALGARRWCAARYTSPRRSSHHPKTLRKWSHQYRRTSPGASTRVRSSSVVFAHQDSHQPATLRSCPVCYLVVFQPAASFVWSTRPSVAATAPLPPASTHPDGHSKTLRLLKDLSHARTCVSFHPDPPPPPSPDSLASCLVYSIATASPSVPRPPLCYTSTNSIPRI